LVGKIERRFTVRHALGWYRTLIITGLYTVDKNSAFDTHSITSYIPALKWCIKSHSFLSATIQGLYGESPVFTRPAELDLRNHIQIIDLESSTYKSTNDELELLKRVVLETHDQPWEYAERIPPWKIVVLPLPDQADSTQKRVYIIYAYSHTHGDAKSALAFHRSFLQGLQTHTGDHDQSQSLIYEPPSSPLPLPLEKACTLKVSWSFLLAPAIAQYMPNIVCRLLRIQAGGNQLSIDRVYTGEITRYDKDDFRTASQILVVKQDLLAKVLAVCRSQRSKLTGLLNRLIVYALSDILPPSTANGFLGQIVVDLRSHIPAYADGMTMGNFVSAVYDTPSRITPNPSSKYDETFWDAVRGTTTRLAAAANTLDDQPIGLLKYLSNFRSWYLGQLGKKRDSSYEISNIGVFDPTLPTNTNDLPTTSQPWSIERTVFSQPANVLASPLNFQVVTMKGGDMVITLNWQVGVTGVPDEDAFAKAILGHVNKGLEEIALET
jgi:hypothetical protein